MKSRMWCTWTIATSKRIWRRRSTCWRCSMLPVSDFRSLTFDSKAYNWFHIPFLSAIGCGHCKKAKPEYEAAAEAFKDDPRIELAAVDCTKHNPVCSAYSVKGFPTFKYFSYLKTVRDYDGGRTVSLEWIPWPVNSFSLTFVQSTVGRFH